MQREKLRFQMIIESHLQIQSFEMAGTKEDFWNMCMKVLTTKTIESAGWHINLIKLEDSNRFIDSELL